MSFRNTLFGIVALYSGLAFAQPKDVAQEYQNQAQQAISAAQAVNDGYKNKTLKLGCVDTIDLVMSFEDGLKELNELYSKIPEGQRNTDLNTKVNGAIDQAYGVLFGDIIQRCGFCSELSREQCGDLDDYINNLQNGIAQAERITKGAASLDCDATDKAYGLVTKFIDAAKKYEKSSQEGEQLDSEYKGIVTLAREKGFSDLRRTFWQEMNRLERTLGANRTLKYEE